MGKRGVFCLLLLLPMMALAETLNVTTDGSGFLLVRYDGIAKGGSAHVEGTYYFLNQLLVQTDLSLEHDGIVLENVSFLPEQENGTFVWNVSQNGTVVYDMMVREVNGRGREYTTKVPVTITMNGSAENRDVIKSAPQEMKDIIVDMSSEEDTPRFRKTNFFIINISTNPDPIVEGVPTMVKADVDILDPNIEDVNFSSFKIGTEEIILNCRFEEGRLAFCLGEKPIVFRKSGSVDASFIIWFIMKNKSMDRQTINLSGDWNLTQGQEDWAVSNSELHFFVNPFVPDLDIPLLGVVNDQPDADAVARRLLLEYQQKKRIALNLDDEFAKVKKTAEGILVEKKLEKVTRLDQDGERVTHTAVKVTLTPKKDRTIDWFLGNKRYVDVMVLEHIAKNAAADVGHVSFQTKGYDIISMDPLVVWHFEKVDGKTDILYEIDKDTDNQGNTVVSADTKRGFPNGVIVIVIIPLIALVIIYFDRFKKHPVEEIDMLKDHPPDYRGIEDTTFKQEVVPESVNTIVDLDKYLDGVELYISRRLQKGDHREHVKQELVRANWPDDLIEKLIKKQEKR